MTKKQSNIGSSNAKPLVNGVPTSKETEIAIAIQHKGVVAELITRCGGVVTSIIKPPPSDNN